MQYTVVASCGIQFSDQDQTQGPLHCRPGVLTHWTTREVPKGREFFGDFGDSVHEEMSLGGWQGKLFIRLSEWDREARKSGPCSAVNQDTDLKLQFR